MLEIFEMRVLSIVALNLIPLVSLEKIGFIKLYYLLD